jgi:hypothetical protein
MPAGFHISSLNFLLCGIAPALALYQNGEQTGSIPPLIYVVLLPRTASGESASRSLEEEGMQTLKTGAALVYDLNGLVARIICHGQDLSRRGLRPWVEELAISVHNGRSLEGDADGVG